MWERKLDLQEHCYGNRNQQRSRKLPGLWNIVFNPERQEMELEEFEKYRDSVQARKDGDAIAGNMGYGGQDDDEQK